MAQVALRTKNSANGPDSTNVSMEGMVLETSHEPSRSHSESSDPIDPDVHVTPPSPVEVPFDDENGDSKQMLDTNEEREASEHWETVSDLASDMTRAARTALLSRRKHFKKVVAVIAYWETATGLEHLRDQADKLGRLFEDKFKFEVLVYRIPENVSSRKFASIIGDELDKVAEDPDSLFILYYGGHASMGDFNNMRWWKKEYHHLSANIEWSSTQRTLFANKAICSKLFLFDCCHAGAMIDPSLEWQTSCELLGACAADVEASALAFSSFTKAFLEVISNNTYAIWELHSALCSTDKRKKYDLAKAPHYQNFMGRRSQSGSALMKKVGSPEETEDRPRRPSDVLTHLKTISDAVTRVTITFRCTADALMKEFKGIKRKWRRLFIFADTDFDDNIVKACHGAKLLAAFDSESCITIWTFPVWLWDAMAPVSGYKQIRIIRPQNFALAASGTQFDPPVTNSSSSMTVGKASVSRRPKKSRKSHLSWTRSWKAPPHGPTTATARKSAHQLKGRRNTSGEMSGNAITWDRC